MTDAQPQSTLREMRRHALTPKVWLACLAVGILLGVAGPFGTGAVMGLTMRLIYWVGVVLCTYWIGFAVHAGFGRFGLCSAAAWVRVPILGAASGVAIFAFMTGVNASLFGTRPSLAELPVNLAIFCGIAILVSYLIDLLPAGQNASAAAPSDPKILQRLPLEKRGSLMALSVEDHYVRVRTTNGEHMVLMRLRDAMDEVEPTQGLQVHRSHWVALEHIRRAARRGDGAIVSLTDGTDIPVSRANVTAIRDAGILPRGS